MARGVFGSMGPMVPSFGEDYNPGPSIVRQLLSRRQTATHGLLANSKLLHDLDLSSFCGYLRICDCFAGICTRFARMFPRFHATN